MKNTHKTETPVGAILFKYRYNLSYVFAVKLFKRMQPSDN